MDIIDRIYNFWSIYKVELSEMKHGAVKFILLLRTHVSAFLQYLHQDTELIKK